MASTLNSEKPVQHIDHVDNINHTDKEHVERVEEHSSQENDIHRIPTLGVDLANAEADKGDESDGKINWTKKQIAATIFLCGLYVGTYTRRCTFFP